MDKSIRKGGGVKREGKEQDKFLSKTEGCIYCHMIISYYYYTCPIP